MINHGVAGLASNVFEIKSEVEQIEISPVPSCPMTDVSDYTFPSQDICMTTEPAIKIKMKFVEEPNEQALDLKPGTNTTAVLDALRPDFSVLFDLFNKTCTLEIAGFDNVVTRKMEAYVEPNGWASFRRTTAEYASTNSRNGYTIQSSCGMDYFGAFVEEKWLGKLNVDGKVEPFGTNPTRFGITTGSELSGVDTVTGEGGAHLHLDFGTSFSTSWGFGSGEPTGDWLGLYDTGPGWLPAGVFVESSIQAAFTSRDAEDDHFNAFPIAGNSFVLNATNSDPSRTIWQAKLYNHEALEPNLNSPTGSYYLWMHADILSVELLPGTRCSA